MARTNFTAQVQGSAITGQSITDTLTKLNAMWSDTPNFDPLSMWDAALRHYVIAPTVTKVRPYIQITADIDNVHMQVQVEKNAFAVPNGGNPIYQGEVESHFNYLWVFPVIDVVAGDRIEAFGACTPNSVWNGLLGPQSYFELEILEGTVV